MAPYWIFPVFLVFYPRICHQFVTGGHGNIAAVRRRSYPVLALDLLRTILAYIPIKKLTQRAAKLA